MRGVRLRRPLIVVLMVGVLATAFLVFQPIGSLPHDVVLGTGSLLRRIGAPGWLASDALWNFVYNTAMFLVVFLVASLIWPRVPVKGLVGIGFLLSLAIECTQAAVLPHRTPQVSDLASNTLGALMGALLARWGRGLPRRKSLAP